MTKKSSDKQNALFTAQNLLHFPQTVVIMQLSNYEDRQAYDKIYFSKYQILGGINGSFNPTEIIIIKNEWIIELRTVFLAHVH